jgi:phage terminase small subunit
MPLTIKQGLFVEAYLADPNGKKAAISAGYSAATAEKAASRLLRHDRVAAELERRRKALKDGSQKIVAKPMTPLEYLMKVVNDPTNTIATRIRAATAALPYTHVKPTASKKDEAAERLKAASGGRFGVRQSSPLAVVRKFPAQGTEP